MDHFPRYIPLKSIGQHERDAIHDARVTRWIGWALLALSVAWGLTPVAHAATARRTQRISGQALAETAQTAVIHGWKKAGYETEVQIVRVPRDLEVTEGPVAWRARCEGVTGGPLGNASVQVDILRDGQITESVLVNLDISVWAQTAFARNAIPRLASISEDQLEWRRVALKSTPELYVQTKEDWDGLRTTRDIPAGMMLARRWLELEPLVRKGDEVDVTSVDGSIRLTLRGIADRDARSEQIIGVRNQENGRVLSARVVSAGHLELAGATR